MRLRSTFLVTLALLGHALPALAQVDAERLKPAVTYDGFVAAEGSAVRHPDDRWQLGAWLHYARNPLVVRDASGDLVRSFVSDRLGFDAVVSASLARARARMPRRGSSAASTRARGPRAGARAGAAEPRVR